MAPVYTICWSLCRLIFAGYFRYRVYNPERVPLEGPVILASNHASYIDPPLIGSGLKRDIHYLARESLFFYAPGRALLRALNCVPVDRDGGGAAGLKGIIDRLLAGGGIILFPETEFKFYLDAHLEERSRRRAADGVQENLAARDQRDSQRAAAPLMIALGATVINNSQMTAAETSSRIIAEVKRKLKYAD